MIQKSRCAMELALDNPERIDVCSMQRGIELVSGLRVLIITLATRREVTNDYGHKNNDSIHKNYKMNA
jgi:hypothetical protein